MIRRVASRATTGSEAASAAASWIARGVPESLAQQVPRAVSPLTAALLRQSPAQWHAALDAVARANASLARVAPPGVLASPAHVAREFARGVWRTSGLLARSGELAGARGVATELARSARSANRIGELAARRALREMQAHRLPTMLVLGGGGTLLPTTARCLERRDASAAHRRGGADDEAQLRRDDSKKITPINVAERTWAERLRVPKRFLLAFERAATIVRALQLAVLFAPCVLTAPMLLYGPWGDWSSKAWYALLRMTLEAGGAAFIKWGQWASTRYDVFPAQLCKELELLQCGAPEHSWRRTKEILERAYGAAQLDEIFAWMDKAPIASGSIAQIHRAKLRNGVAEKNGARTFTIHERLLRSVGSGVELLAKGEWRGLLEKMRSEWVKSAGRWEWNPGSYLPNPYGGTTDGNGSNATDAGFEPATSATKTKPLGERPDDVDDEGRYVAVKVRHPGVVEALRRDFAILAWIARATRNVEALKPFQLEHTVQQFGVHMLQQVDLTLEASNLQKFEKAFSLWGDVSFPVPVGGLATEEVLVETFEDGVSISTFLMDDAHTASIDAAIQAALGAKMQAEGVAAEEAAERDKKRTKLEIRGDVSRIHAAAEAANAAAEAAAEMVPVENRALAAIGVKTLLKMLIDDNFLHADLHPGNILVRLPGGIQGGFSTLSDVVSSETNAKANSGEISKGDGSDGGKNARAAAPPTTTTTRKAKAKIPSVPEIVILDTGLATELTPAHQASLAEFFQAIINWDGASVARNIIAFSSNLQPSFDPVAFTSDVTTAVRHFQDSTPRAGDCMAAIFETVQRHHVTLDPNVMVAVVTVMVLEGWQFRLDPSINILDYIGDVMRSSFRKHQRLTVMDFGLRDMWAPFSEPNALTMDRSGARPMAWSMQASVDNAGGLWYGSY